jgi:hypothetical protein
VLWEVVGSDGFVDGLMVRNWRLSCWVLAMYGRDTTKGNEEIDIGRRHEAQRLFGNKSSVSREFIDVRDIE